MALRVIENYEPDDHGWAVSLGRLIPKPEPEEQPAEDVEEQQPEPDGD